MLTATGFPSEADAKLFLVQARASFAWLLLQKGVAAEADLDPQPIRYFDDPVEAAANIGKSFGGKLWERVDTIIQGSQSAIYPSQKEVRVATALPVGVYTSIPVEHALEVLAQGAGRPDSHRVAEDNKLAVALALYGAYFTEHSAKARFLTLVMALEALAAATLKAPLALELIDRWQNEVSILKADASRTAEDLASLESLERELLFRREDSIRSQIRRLVLESLAPADDAAQSAREVLKLYDTRSRLVHEGTIDQNELDRATGRAKELVHRVLKARFETVVNG
ncbi:MAG: HEPN domain-containing protein [Inhella sp.]